MIRINLLDWRAEARETRRKRFITSLAVAAMASVALAGVLPTYYYNHLIDAQQSRNRYLKDQITAADTKLKEIRALKQTRKSLVKRMRIIEELQQSRASIVHYLDQLVATIPEGVHLTGLSQKGDTTTLDGIAESNARVSDYMVNLDASGWFTNPRLIVIKSSDQSARRYADFTLRVDASKPVQSKQNSGHSTVAKSNATTQ